MEKKKKVDKKTECQQGQEVQEKGDPQKCTSKTHIEGGHRLKILR